MLRRLFKTMSNPNKQEFPPPIHRGMQILDRGVFKKELPLVVAKLGDPSFLSALNRHHRNDLLQLQGVSRVVDYEHGKGVLLNHKVDNHENVYDQLSDGAAQIFRDAKSTFEPYKLVLDYNYWRADEILAAILPEEYVNEVPSGYTTVGHIAHMNVREEFLPYKYLIGQVILDKNPSIKTVVNKLDSIGSVYRTFDLEVLAGEPNFMVEQSESGCRFRFDFSKVYWNSRLHTEHDRLIRQFKKGEAACDVMAGVGPFAVPAGKKGVLVFANDLNPASYESLAENIKLNKVGATVTSTNQDGNQFIKESAVRLLTFSQDKGHIEIPTKRPSRSKSQQPEKVTIPKSFAHYVMNLPDSAIEFLHSFVGLYADPKLRVTVFGTATPEPTQLPMIHVYCFYKWDPHSAEPTLDEAKEHMRQRVNRQFNYEIPITELDFHNVRKVAPTKTMYCISFRLPTQIAF